MMHGRRWAFLLVPLLFHMVVAELRSDHVDWLSQFQNRFNGSSWSGAPTCAWYGVTCCPAGDCDPTFELLSVLDLSDTYLGGAFDVDLGPLSGANPIELRLSRTGLTSIPALSHVNASNLAVSLDENTISDCTISNTTIGSVSVFQSCRRIRLHSVTIQNSLSIFSDRAEEVTFTSVAFLSRNDFEYFGQSSLPTWAALKNVTILDTNTPFFEDQYSNNALAFAADLDEFRVERSGIQKIGLFDGPTGNVGRMILQDLLVPTDVVLSCTDIASLACKRFEVHAINVDAIMVGQFILEDISGSAIGTFFPSVLKVDTIYARNCTLQDRAFLDSMFHKEDSLFIPSFGDVHIEDWDTTHLRLGSPRSVFLKGPFSSTATFVLRDCWNCTWLHSLLSTSFSGSMEELVVENCSLTNATWLERPPFRHHKNTLSIANNDIEHLDIELPSSALILTLDVRGNPLKTFRLIRTIAADAYELEALYFDGASERIEIDLPQLVQPTRFDWGLFGSRKNIRSRVPPVLTDATFNISGVPLTHLDISGHKVAGNFPSILLRLFPSLTSLDISFNNFTGAIPSNIWSSGSLGDLRISNNNFSGSFPNPTREVSVLKIANNKFVGIAPSPAISSTNAIYWDLQNNYFSQFADPIPVFPLGSSVDLSDNLFSCPGLGDWNLLGVSGDFSRNLCERTAPCRRFEILKCTRGCEQSLNTDFSMSLIGQLPDRSLYTAFSVAVGPVEVDCLSQSTYVAFTANSTLATCTIAAGAINATGRVLVTVAVTGVPIHSRVFTGHSLVPTPAAAPSPCVKQCRVAIESGPTTFHVYGAGLPTSSDNVQSFVLSVLGSKRSSGLIVDCKSDGLLYFNNGTTMSCTVPPHAVDAEAYGKQLTLSVVAFSAPLFSSAPTGVSISRPTRAASVAQCQSNCVRRSTSSKLVISVYGENFPTSVDDISVFNVSVGSGLTPAGLMISCTNSPTGVVLRLGNPSNIICEVESSLFSDSISGAVAVDLIVWGRQVVLSAEPTGEFLQSGSESSSVQSAVGIGVGVSIAVVVVVAVAVVVVLLVVRRRFKAINQMQTVEMQELKGKLSDEEIKAVLNIKASDITLISKLGSGAFGTVWLANYQGRVVAVKKLTGSALSGQLAEFFREASLMLSIPRHPNIVTVYGLCQDIAALSMVMELVGNGSLDKFLQKAYGMGNPIQAGQLQSLVLGIAEGMEHLAAAGIVHRDLAARNVLVTDDLTPKIADFGMSRNIGDSGSEGKTQTQFGPIKWMSPEAIQQTYSEKSDVWAYGVTVWECLTGEEPYGEMDLMQLAVSIRDNGFNLSTFIPDTCPAYLKELMNWCWRTKPADRPTFKQIVSFLKENDPSIPKRTRKDKSKDNTARTDVETVTKRPESSTSDAAPDPVRRSSAGWTAGVVDPSKAINEVEASDSGDERVQSSQGDVVVYSNFMGDQQGDDSPAEDRKERK